ncbi:hypothetical protein FPV67DRAFT_218222 [Lyophyllum atratum]|nr:hypothetical protein FPV67DRAFT_218222 [Lyophyllum atratum]
MAANFVFLDDTSSNFTYTGSWISGGVSVEYNGTTHGTATAGTQATVLFTGSSIEVYGTIGAGNDSFVAVSSYTIDGDLSSTTTFTGRPASVVQYKQSFYTSPRLSAKDHVLVITCVTLNNRHQLLLDYVRVGQESDAQPNPASPTTNEFPSPSQPTSQPPSQSASQTTSPTTSQISSPSAGLSKGAIAGIVIGSLLAFCLVIVIILLWRRFSTRAKGPVPPPHVTPFDSDASRSQPPLTTTFFGSHLRKVSNIGPGSGASAGSPPPYTTRGDSSAADGVLYPYAGPGNDQAFRKSRAG